MGSVWAAMPGGAELICQHPNAPNFFVTASTALRKVRALAVGSLIFIGCSEGSSPRDVMERGDTPGIKEQMSCLERQATA